MHYAGYCHTEGSDPILRQWEEYCVASQRLWGFDPSKHWQDIILVVDAGKAVFKVSRTIAGTQITCYFHLKQAIEGMAYLHLFARDMARNITDETVVATRKAFIREVGMIA